MSQHCKHLYINVRARNGCFLAIHMSVRMNIISHVLKNRLQFGKQNEFCKAFLQLGSDLFPEPVIDIVTEISILYINSAASILLDYNVA